MACSGSDIVGDPRRPAAAGAQGSSRLTGSCGNLGAMGERERSWLVVVSGWTGAGKSTISDAIADQVGATVASFDWLMSGLRADPAVWAALEQPVELQRRIGWNLLSRVAEQQLRAGRSCVLDLVAREEPRAEWADLAARHDAGFAVVECVCEDEELHRSRVEGRDRAIPGWYELTWARVQRGRELYPPLAEPKVVIDASRPVSENLDTVMAHLRAVSG